MPTAPLIAYAHVGKSFDGGHVARVAAVDDVSLEVTEGEFLAIVGGSGSGKTTLLRLANRLIEADSGHITIEGADVRAVDPVQLRRRIGYVFQSGGLFPHHERRRQYRHHAKAVGRAGWPRSPHGSTNCSIWCGSTARNIAIACPRRFPDGQRQRVGVARALAATRASC